MNFIPISSHSGVIILIIDRDRVDGYRKGYHDNNINKKNVLYFINGVSSATSLLR